MVSVTYKVEANQYELLFDRHLAQSYAHHDDGDQTKLLVNADEIQQLLDQLWEQNVAPSGARQAMANFMQANEMLTRRVQELSQAQPAGQVAWYQVQLSKLIDYITKEPSHAQG